LSCEAVLLAVAKLCYAMVVSHANMHHATTTSKQAHKQLTDRQTTAVSCVEHVGLSLLARTGRAFQSSNSVTFHVIPSHSL